MRTGLFYTILITGTLLIAMFLLWLYYKMKATQAVNNPNVQAFLRVIRFAEGTAGPNGYRTMFTGKLFDNGFADHPRVNNCAGTLCSTAAGAYQFLAKTWDEVAFRLQLPDFSPESQDIAAVELIRRRGALNDVIAGNFESAIQKVNKEWASMPGSPYGQPTKTIAELKSVYQNNGGSYA